MSTINLVWRTDVHMADVHTQPSSRTDVWWKTILGKLGQVRNIASEHSAAAILDGGDFFHVKQPHRNTHALVHRTMEHHRTYPCPVYCTPGNHDSVYGDYSFLDQQPLGVLFESGTFKRLYDGFEVYFAHPESEMYPKAYPFNRKGSWLRGNPFSVKRKGPVVRCVGVPYHGSTYDMSRFTSIEKGEEDILVCTAHVLASLKGGKMFEGEDIIRYSDLLDTAPDVFCFGHWHKDQGVEVLGDKTFINIGSLTRGSLSQDEVQRRPACAVIKCGMEKVDVDVVRLEVGPAEEVFDVDARARQVQRQVEMDSFVERIREGLAPADSTTSLTSVVKSMEDLPDEVRERALAYMEEAQGTVK